MSAPREPASGVPGTASASSPGEEAGPFEGRAAPEVLAALAGTADGSAGGSVESGDPAAALERLFALAPGAFLRRIPGRETFAWPAPAGAAWIVKRTRGGEARDWWHERLHGERPRSPAQREHDVLRALFAAGLPVPEPLAWFAEERARERPPRGARTAGGRSVLVMRRVEHAGALDERLAAAEPAERRPWTSALVALVARLHDAGWIHRDLYLSHFLTGSEPGALFLIDVGRARGPGASARSGLADPGSRRLPARRWLVKDLAALLHSAPACTTRAERLRFLRDYLGTRGLAGRAALRAWAAAVVAKAGQLGAHVPRYDDAGTGSAVATGAAAGAAASSRASSAPAPAAGRRLALAIQAPNWLGDLVMATPVLEAALADERFASVTILVREPLIPALAGGPSAPHVLAVRDRRRVGRMLRELAPDAILLLGTSARIALQAFLARVPIRAGAGLSGRRFLLTHAVVPPTSGGRRAPIPTAHLLRDVAGLLGIAVPDLHPRLHVAAETRARATAALERAGLAAGTPYAVCAPGAAFGAAKRWPTERFAAALAALHERRGLAAVVTGSPAEAAVVEEVAALTRAARVPVAVLPSEAGGLDALKAVIADARLLLVGDSGPRWYAAAFDVPCVSVMGPNFPELTATSLERCRIVRRDGLECAPCVQRECPLGTRRCMAEIPVERVVAAAEELLLETAAAS